MIYNKFKIILIITLISILSVCHANNDDQQKAEAELAIESAIDSGTYGPNKIHLDKFGELTLPEGYIFFHKKEAERFMKSIGNINTNELVGVVMGSDDEHAGDYYIMISYYGGGYVKDDDVAKVLAASDKLLKIIHDNTEKNNAEITKAGFTPLHIQNWIDKPSYDETTHMTHWSLSAISEENEEIINAKALILGRSGLYSIVLAGERPDFDKNRFFFKEIVDNISYVPGYRYSDYDSKVDIVSPYTLTALITGVAAKKLGIFAMIGAFIIKFWKIVILGGAVSLWATLKRFATTIKYRFNPQKGDSNV